MSHSESRPELPRPLAWDDSYWLMRCEGFHVETPRGRLGMVTEVHYHSRHDRPDEIVVRRGGLGKRLAVIPVDDVQEIVPGQARIVLETDPRPNRDDKSHERLRRLRAYLTGVFAGD